MRIRYSGSFTTPSFTTVTTRCDGSTVTSAPYSSATLKVGQVKEMGDVSIPGFKRAQAKGAVFVNPMYSIVETRAASANPSYELFTGTCSGLPTKRIDHGFLLGSSCVIPGYLEPSSSVLSSMKTEAYTAARGRVDQPDVMGLVDLAEARKTISGLGEIVGKFRFLTTQLRRSAAYQNFLAERSLRDSWSNFSGFMSSNWLAYRYMFLPLILSAKGVVQALDSKKLLPERQTARASVSSTDTAAFTSAWSVPFTNWESRLLASLSVTTEVRAGVLYELVRAKTLASNLGIEGNQIPNALWELTSWSFVVDWFFNVGDLISAVSASVGTRSLGSWTVVKQRSVITWYTELRWTASTYMHADGKGQCSGVATRETVTREPGGSVGFTLRTFQAHWVDFVHLTDAIALLRQATRS